MVREWTDPRFAATTLAAFPEKAVANAEEARVRHCCDQALTCMLLLLLLSLCSCRLDLLATSSGSQPSRELAAVPGGAWRLCVPGRAACAGAG